MGFGQPAPVEEKKEVAEVEKREEEILQAVQETKAQAFVAQTAKAQVAASIETKEKEKKP